MDIQFEINEGLETKDRTPKETVHELRVKRLQMKRDNPSLTFMWEFTERNRSVQMRHLRETARLKQTPQKKLRLHRRTSARLRVIQEEVLSF